MAGNYTFIRFVLNVVINNRGDGGLMSLRVTQIDPDQEDPTTRILLDKHEIADTLRDLNTEHYGQDT